VNKIRVIVASGHDVVRAGIRHLLRQQQDIEVVAEACDGHTAVQMCREYAPNVTIMDAARQSSSGIDVACQIFRHEFKTGVIVLGMLGEEDYLMRALAVGVRGYVLKESAQQDLGPAIRTVARGKAFFSPAITQILAEEYARRLQRDGLADSYELLTERERQILQLVAAGNSKKEIAIRLNLSPSTVETHRAHVMRKLDLHNTAEIVRYAVRKKIVK
jgi:two-component system response regulator NreC